MANFKPQITVITSETERDARNSFKHKHKSSYKTIQYDTYRELKRNIQKHLEENLENEIHLCRSKRGEWGEWYEIWKLENGKPIIERQGWN